MRRAMGLQALERVEARRRAAAAGAAARVEQLRAQMAELATAITALEAQAQQLGVTPDGALSGAAAPAGADAERQVEAIDALLDGVRAMRAALEQQRAELALAEEDIQPDDAGGTASETEQPLPHGGTDGA